MWLKHVFLLAQKPKVKIRHDSRTTKVCPHATVMAEFGDCNRGINISMLNQALGVIGLIAKLEGAPPIGGSRSAWELGRATIHKAVSS